MRVILTASILCLFTGCGSGGGEAGSAIALIDVGEGAHMAAVQWEAPTASLAGDPIADLSGYIVYVGRNEEEPLSEQRRFEAGTANAAAVMGLGNGTYIFRIAAVSSAVLEGPPSDPVSVSFSEAPTD